MKFQQIRSATAIVTFGGSRFLIDPWLAPKDSCPPIPGSANPGLRCPIHELPMPLEDILKVDAVIATHLHFDHFDETAMQVIPKKVRGGVILEERTHKLKDGMTSRFRCRL